MKKLLGLLIVLLVFLIPALLILISAQAQEKPGNNMGNMEPYPSVGVNIPIDGVTSCRADGTETNHFARVRAYMSERLDFRRIPITPSGLRMTQ